MNYHWKDINAKKLPFRKSFLLNDDHPVRLYTLITPESTHIRKNEKGWFTFVTEISGTAFAVLYNDFRIQGGSFNSHNSQKIQSFLKACDKESYPVILCINSMGVSLSEGRQSFHDAFSLIPLVSAYAEKHKIYSVAQNNAFGLGALLLSLGSYRLGIEKTTQINLTGPVIYQKFLGASLDFNRASELSAGNYQSSVVHEIVDDLEDALNRIVSIEKFRDHPMEVESTGIEVSKHLVSNPYMKQLYKNALRQTEDFLDSFCDNTIELFNNFDEKLKVFIGSISGVAFGIMINPLGYPDNLLSERSLRLAHECILFFKHQGLPIVSVLDTPGTSPLQDPGTFSIIERFKQVATDIIDFPHVTVGIIAGRGFGGATIMGFPKIYGGTAVFALDNAKMNLMDAGNALDLLPEQTKQDMPDKDHLNGTPEESHYNDILDYGYIDKVIDRTEIRDHLLSVFRENRVLKSEKNADKESTLSTT